MRKIRTDQININAGVSNKGEPRPTSYPVDVWAQDNCTDEVFKGTGVPQGGDPGRRGPSAEPGRSPQWSDSTFTPHDIPTAKKPGASE